MYCRFWEECKPNLARGELRVITFPPSNCSTLIVMGVPVIVLGWRILEKLTTEAKSIEVVYAKKKPKTNLTVLVIILKAK